MANSSADAAADALSKGKVFDVDAERLARVYAQAGLDAAGDLQSQGDLAEELVSVAEDVLASHPEMAEIFRSKLISEDEKLGVIDRVFGGRGSDSLLNLLKVMTRHGRLGMVPDVARSAYGIWETRAGRIHVELECPQPVSDSLLKEITTSLASALGAQPHITTSVNPELLAGFVVRVGDKVYDASAKTRLERSRHAMVEQAVEAIQQHPEQFIENSAS